MKKVKYKKRVSPGIFNKVKIIKGKKKFIKYFGTPVILNCDAVSRVLAVANMNEHIEYCQFKNFEEAARKAFPEWEYKDNGIMSTPATISHRIIDIVRHLPVDTGPVIDPKKIGRGVNATKL